jgi:hypothetical protein
VLHDAVRDGVHASAAAAAAALHPRGGWGADRTGGQIRRRVWGECV